MPSAAPSESRLHSTPVSGTSSERNSTTSARKPSPTTMSRNHGSASASTWVKSTVTAWKPPTYAFAPDSVGRGRDDVARAGGAAGRWSPRPAVTSSGYTWTGATVASLATGGAAARATPGSAFSASTRVSIGCLVAGARQLDREVERPVDAGPEALGREVVRDPRRAALRRAAVVGEAQPQRQHRDRDDEHHDERERGGEPRPLLQPAAVAGEGVGLGAGRGRGPCARTCARPARSG